MHDSTRYYLGFNLVNGIGPARLERLRDAFGSLGDAWGASAGELLRIGLDPKSVESLLSTRRSLDLDAELERIAAAGVRLITREDPAYPDSLVNIPSPPPLLYVRGSLSADDSWAVAVVGTRSPTSYGRDNARRFASELAAAGITVVSGLALGTDTIAHTAAIEANGRTIAVLPCGVDFVYPERNGGLAQQIIERGALVSEFPYGTRPSPQLFPVRNRLISGLARGVLVVEAGETSGALITVNYALEQSRDVFAIPGPIYSLMSVGTNRIIRDGAHLVTAVHDILSTLDMVAAASRRETRAAMPTDLAEIALISQIGYEPRSADELSRALDLPIADVSATLTMLEIKGLVRQIGAMQFVLQ